MTIKTVITGAGSASVTGPIFQSPSATITFTDNTIIQSVRIVYTSSAKVATRQVQYAAQDSALNVIRQVGWASTGQTASQTHSYETGSTAETVNNIVYAPNRSPLIIPPGGLIRPYDNNLSTNRTVDITGTATAATATTMTDGAANWGANIWVGYNVTMGPATGIVTSHSATVLTMAGGWSQLVAGTAEDSDATTMTDNDAAWTVDGWAGYTVSMGGSTATIISNTATVLTIGAWAPLAPATGAYTIFGAYSLTGDTADLFITYYTTQQIEG